MRHIPPDTRLAVLPERCQRITLIPRTETSRLLRFDDHLAARTLNVTPRDAHHAARQSRILDLVYEQLPGGNDLFRLFPGHRAHH
jgi:hypothetical protein